MMRKTLNIFILIALFLGGSCLNAKKYESPAYTKYVKEIVSEFIKDNARKNGLSCSGRGGSMPYDVEKIHVSFEANHPATIEEARKLEVLLIEKLTAMVNAHEKIRPFLREYPFPPTRISIMLGFPPPTNKQKENEKEDNKYIHLLFRGKKNLVYHTKNPGPVGYTVILREPYEEARKIVLGSDADQEITPKLNPPNQKGEIVPL